MHILICYATVTQNAQELQAQQSSRHFINYDTLATLAMLQGNYKTHFQVKWEKSSICVCQP